MLLQLSIHNHTIFYVVNKNCEVLLIVELLEKFRS
jgi:hypothetical protein